MDGSLRIETSARSDAECVADQLAGYGPRVDQCGDKCTVVVPAGVSHAVLTGVLDALQACLDDRDIASVKVTMDSRSYMMEGNVDLSLSSASDEREARGGHVKDLSRGT